MTSGSDQCLNFILPPKVGLLLLVRDAVSGEMRFRVSALGRTTKKANFSIIDDYLSLVADSSISEKRIWVCFANFGSLSNCGGRVTKAIDSINHRLSQEFIESPHVAMGIVEAGLQPVGTVITPFTNLRTLWRQVSMGKAPKLSLNSDNLSPETEPAPEPPQPARPRLRLVE